MACDEVCRKNSGRRIIRESSRQAEDLGSNPCDCQIFYLFRCLLSSLLLM